MHTPSLLRRLLVTFAIVAAAVAVGRPASARRVFPGMLASPTSSADAPCFVHLSTGAIQNTCSTPRWLDLPVTVDAASWYGITVDGSYPSYASVLQCSAVSVNAGNWVEFTTGLSPMPWNSGQASSVSVLATNYGVDSVMLRCYVPTTGTIFNYYW